MTQSTQLSHRRDIAETHVEGEVFDPAPHRPTARALGLLGASAAVVAAGLVAAGAIPRTLQRAAVETEAAAAGALVPQVQTARVERAPAGLPVILPGTVQPLQETAMYARASGYVHKWYVDIGTQVTKGQVLADLDLPDLDQELRQARASANQAVASVGQARSELKFARVTNDRFAALAPSGLVSQQLIDQYSSEYEVRQANLEAAQAAEGSAHANVRRIEELRGFGTITAPFDGVITQRSAEIGQLVVPGTGQGQVLFKVAEDDVVRVFVNVPQLYAGGIYPTMDAAVTVREASGRVFHGRVARTSRELDTATRALLVEVDIPNLDRALVSGMYAKVSLDVRRQDASLLVPATSASIDAEGTRVALVRDGAIHWQKVEIGSDLGDRLTIAAGLAEGDSVVLTPSERLAEGMHVQLRTVPPPHAP
jgi:membrane fusion protein, multidrug efflux system